MTRPLALPALVYLLCALPSAHSIFAQSRQSSASSPTCATCHVGVATSYVHAPMRHALESPDANPVLDTHPNLTLVKDGYTYTVATKDGHSTYTVTDGKDSLTLPIRWMFGQHTQTWVLEKDGHFYESLVSYFPRENGLATTPGDDRLTPHSVSEAMGRLLNTWETFECFSCHATRATDGPKLTLDTLRPGIQCERCHLGALQHMADAAKDNFTTIPPKLRPMDADQAANFCGQCHRTWDFVVRYRLRGQIDVRFQPYRLENSKCFIANDRRISCLACHDPHQPLNHNQAYYDAKCQACHAPSKTSAASSSATPNSYGSVASSPTVASSITTDSSPIKSCPVGREKCATCHMPKIELPGGHVAFTDHLIRIVHPGEPYPD
ncbi:MAG: multiheme c-type cytochrome [Terracidiphilus sp.]